jgi:hypothetical protein
MAEVVFVGLVAQGEQTAEFGRIEAGEADIVKIFIIGIGILHPHPQFFALGILQQALAAHVGKHVQNVVLVSQAKGIVSIVVSKSSEMAVAALCTKLGKPLNSSPYHSEMLHS